MEFAATILRLPERSKFMPLWCLGADSPWTHHHCPFGSDWALKSRDQAISTAFGDQDFGMGGVTLNFLPQTIDVGFKRVG